MFRVVASIVFVIVVIVAFFVGNRETSTTDTPEVQSQPLPATPGKNFNF